MEFYFYCEVCKPELAILLNMGLHYKFFSWVLQRKIQKGYAMKHTWAVASLFLFINSFALHKDRDLEKAKNGKAYVLYIWFYSLRRFNVECHVSFLVLDSFKNQAMRPIFSMNFTDVIAN